MIQKMVSVVVPFYNVEKYIRECVESLINQTYKDFEVIFVNDGSLDGTNDIVEEYIKDNKDFRIIKQENAGLSAARNTGIQYANGKYIYFLDSDDYLVNDALERLVNLSEANELDAIRFSAYTFTDEDKNLLWNFNGYKYRGNYKGVFSGNELLKVLLKTGDKNLVNIGHLFTRREIIVSNDLLFREGIIHEDISYNWEVLCLSKRVMICNEPLHCKRTRSGSIMTTLKYPNELQAMIGSIKETDEFMIKQPQVSKKDNNWYLSQYAIKSLQFYNQMESKERKNSKHIINELRHQIYAHRFWGKFNLFLFCVSPNIYSVYHALNMGIRNIWKRK